jgi:hypothetical protein
VEGGLPAPEAETCEVSFHSVEIVEDVTLRHHVHAEVV